jgi:Hypoxia induced protein conserved region
MRNVGLRFEGASFHYIFVPHGRLGGDTMDLLTIIIILALIGTGVSMALGLLAMSGGGATDRLFSTRLMWTRVGFQAFTLLLLVAAVVLR